jgi:hypothetical protein
MLAPPSVEQTCHNLCFTLSPDDIRGTIANRLPSVLKPFGFGLERLSKTDASENNITEVRIYGSSSWQSIVGPSLVFRLKNKIKNKKIETNKQYIHD